MSGHFRPYGMHTKTMNLDIEECKEHVYVTINCYVRFCDGFDSTKRIIQSCIDILYNPKVLH